MDNEKKFEVKEKRYDVAFRDLDELNEKFFALCSRVNVYSSLMPEKIADYMADKLYEQYKVSYAIYATKKATKDGSDLYVLKKRKFALVPWKFLFFRNKIGKITDKELKKEFKKLFTERIEGLKNKETDGDKQ